MAEDPTTTAPLGADQQPPSPADSGETAPPPPEEPQEELNGNGRALGLETYRIQQLAQLWGVAPVLSRADLKVQEITHDETLREWMYQEADDLCIMDDHTIISSQPGSPEVEAACSLLALRGLTAEVRPALPEVVRSFRRILEGSEGQIGDTMLEIEDQTETDVSRLFESMIDTAIARDVSDIHFEMRNNTCEIRFRVDGQMTLYDTITARETMALGNYMFNAEAKRGAIQFVTHIPLHGSMDANVRGQRVALRLSTAPDIRGVDIFLRVWRPDAASLSLEELGYTPLQIGLLSEAITRPYGAIIMSGPTGSGKSTTLTAMLERVDPAVKIVSLEEPVERMLPNVTHVAISALAEHGGWVNLRAGLNRWDSNINMLGEIKDRETADAIQDLVTAGKLTLTTLHASNVLAIPARLEDLGVAYSMICDPNFLVLLANQRLLPRLCQTCRAPYVRFGGLPTTVKARFDWKFGDQAEQVYMRGPGCNACAGTGIRGRVLAAEIVMMDDASRVYIRERDMTGWRKHLVERGWRSIMDHACEHLFQGTVDPRAVEQAAGHFDESQIENFDYAKIEDLHREAPEQ